MAGFKMWILCRPAEEPPSVTKRRYDVKGLFLLALISLTTVFSAAPLPGQGLDLSGTWVGETVVPNVVDKDHVTLVLKKDAGSYSGTVTDSREMAQDSPLEDVKFENDTLTAQFMIFNGSDYVRIWMTLKVSGEKLIGSWKNPTGSSTGPLELERKKE